MFMPLKKKDFKNKVEIIKTESASLVGLPILHFTKENFIHLYNVSGWDFVYDFSKPNGAHEYYGVGMGVIYHYYEPPRPKRKGLFGKLLMFLKM